MLDAKLEWIYQKGKLGQLQARDMVGMVLRYSQYDNQNRPIGDDRSDLHRLSHITRQLKRSSHWSYFIYRI